MDRRGTCIWSWLTSCIYLSFLLSEYRELTLLASAAQVREIVQQELAEKKTEMDRAIAELTVERERFHEMQEQMSRFME